MKNIEPAKFVAKASLGVVAVLLVSLCAISVADAQCKASEFDGKLGYYGVPWAQQVAQGRFNAGFVILPVDIDRFNGMAETIRGLKVHNVAVFARIRIFKDAAERARASRDEIERNQSRYVDKALNTVAALKKLGVTAGSLDEENIAWSGRDALLASLYNTLKRKFPDFHVYQWYSASRNSTVPGGGGGFASSRWPSIPADGWVMSGYFYSPDDYTRFLDGYLALGKPVITYIWASPTWSPDGGGLFGVFATDPNVWNQSERYRMARLLAIDAARCVPTALFAFTKNKGPARPLFEATSPEAKRFVGALDRFMHKNRDGIRPGANAAQFTLPAWK